MSAILTNSCWFIVALLIWSGCAAQNSTTAASSSSRKDDLPLPPYLQDYPPQQHEDLKPISPEHPIFYATAPPVQAEPYEFKTLITLEAVEDGDESNTQRIVQGYRVQVFAGREREFARNMEKRLKKGYLLPVYMTFEAPQYKVRIGDYVNRSEAVSFCDELQNAGFRDAWVVKAQVTVSQ